MIPIHQLLSRIRWDPALAGGDFELGYYDRVEKRVLLVPFRSVDFPPNNPQVFRLVDAAGRIHRVPFHRVRKVYRNGECIWQRPAPHE